MPSVVLSVWAHKFTVESKACGRGIIIRLFAQPLGYHSLKGILICQFAKKCVAEQVPR